MLKTNPETTKAIISVTERIMSDKTAGVQQSTHPTTAVKKTEFGGSFRSGCFFPLFGLMIRVIFHCHPAPLQNADRSESRDWGSFSRLPSNECSVQTWEPQQEPRRLLWQLSPAVSLTLESILKWIGSTCRWRFNTWCDSVYAPVRVCCVYVSILSNSSSWLDTHLRPWVLLWERMQSWAARLLNTIFTAVSAPLFQPQVSEHQFSVAQLQGCVWFGFPVTDCNCKWKRTSLGSKQSSVTLWTCLQGCAVMQMMSMKAQLNK